MSYLSFIKKEAKIHFDSIKQNYIDSKDKELFRASGLTVYCGWQGSGKTLSAVKHVYNLMVRYPKSILVTNLDFNSDLPNKIITFKNHDDLHRLLVEINNDKYGVIYLIDEIHTYFNALESKDIPPYIFTEISQQRKQRKAIIGTSQLFLRMAKPFREQANYLVMCSTHCNIFTVNKVYDAHKLTTDYSGQLIGHAIKMGFFFHSEKLRNMYDTLQKVVSGKAEFEDFQTVNVEQKKRKGFRVTASR